TRPARSTRATRSASTGPSRVWPRPRGGSSAAIRGAVEGWTSRDRRRRADPDRARAPPRPRLAPRHGGAPLGLVDRRAHRDRPDADRPARRPPDPLDAEPAAARAADEGDPAQVQAGQAAP